MIRPFTCLAFLLACGSGLYVYQTKHRVKLLDEQITQTIKSTDALREQTRMLSAEWTLLNDPERLRQLANQFLTLQTVSPNQFTSLADLDSRLPPPGPTPGAAADAVVQASAAPVPADAAGRTATDEGKPADARLAEAPPLVAQKDLVPAAGHAAVPPAASPAPHVALAASSEQARAADGKPTASRVAAAAPLPRPVASQPRPSEPRVPEPMLAEARPMAAPLRAPSPPPMPQPVYQPAGSLLGMAHGMAAPPAPMPLPRPMPVSVPLWSSSPGG